MRGTKNREQMWQIVNYYQVCGFKQNVLIITLDLKDLDTWRKRYIAGWKKLKPHYMLCTTTYR